MPPKAKRGSAKSSPNKHKKALNWLHKYLRYIDYLSAAQLYLKDNYFLDKPLEHEHIKARILGHWGTVPGLNFIYATLNYLVAKNKCEVLMVTGPGHGAPAILSNLYAEGTLKEFYKQYSLDKKGAGRIIRDFSWPHSPFPSHVTPSVPGSILEGGELGYSLATAYGAALDNPNLIVAVAVGDGEAESGPTATAWHSNKWLNPKTSGAVLPIIHVNGYKISNPTLYGTMSDKELMDLFTGYGYETIIVKDPNIEANMLEAMDQSYKIIRDVQKKARKSKTPVLKPKWPVIILRSPKGWNGIHRYKGVNIEGSFHSHGIPLGKPKSDEKQLKAVEKWLQSYKVDELVDKKGRPNKDVMTYVPTGSLRIGMNKHAIGGNMMKDLNIPKLGKLAVKVKKRGAIKTGNMAVGAKMLRDVFKLNKKNFRIMCPDEIESNKLGAIFDATKRAYMWPVPKNAENVGPDGRAMEMLSEHTLQGWLQGYVLTGRHGMFVTYEAFAGIISSMVDQHAKFLKQSHKIGWRKAVPSAIYLLSSLGWRQDHNGYSHQNPSFVSGVLQKHGEFSQIYYPSDGNSLLAAYEEVMKRKDGISVIVVGKRELPQYQTLKEARQQAKRGLGIWKWVGGMLASRNPDVVLSSAGDYMTNEALKAAKICGKVMPELKIRYVNVSEVTSMALGDYSTYHCKECLNVKEFEKYFTKNKPVVMAYHGYTNDIEHILWPYADSGRFTIHGYQEEGSTTTPGDMLFRNNVSACHLAIDLINEGAKSNKKVAKKRAKVVRRLKKMLAKHEKHIRKHGDDLPEVKELDVLL